MVGVCHILLILFLSNVDAWDVDQVTGKTRIDTNDHYSPNSFAPWRFLSYGRSSKRRRLGGADG